MKKLLIVLALGLLAAAAYCAVNQPQSVGDITANKVGLGKFTIAQINALTPDTTGQMVYCSDCAYATICISTGADSGRVGAWVAVSTGTQNHCL